MLCFCIIGLMVFLLWFTGCAEMERAANRWHGVDVDAWNQALCTPESLAKGVCAPKPGVLSTPPVAPTAKETP